MIYKYFGKPHLPTVLSDCLLIIPGKKPISIKKVYLFTSNRSVLVREFGELWPSDYIILDNGRIVGYFNCRFNIDTFNDSYEGCTIQSSTDYKIAYKLNNVRFAKIKSSFGQYEKKQYIKFSCMDFNIIFRDEE